MERKLEKTRVMEWSAYGELIYIMNSHSKFSLKWRVYTLYTASSNLWFWELAPRKDLQRSKKAKTRNEVENVVCNMERQEIYIMDKDTKAEYI